MKHKNGLLIALEGIECCGKDTAMEDIATITIEKQKEYDISLSRSFEPGGTVIGNRIRQLVKDKDYRTIMSNECTLLLYMADRAQKIHELYNQALIAKPNNVFITNRSIFTGRAYQGMVKGFSVEKFDQAHELFFNESIYIPDKVILLDISPKESIKRMQKEMSSGNSSRNKQNTRWEDEGLKFLNNARSAYMEMATKDPNRWIVVNGEQFKESVKTDVETAIDSILSERFEKV